MGVYLHGSTQYRDNRFRNNKRELAERILVGSLFQTGAVLDIKFWYDCDSFKIGRIKRRLWPLVIEGGSKSKCGVKNVVREPLTIECTQTRSATVRLF